MPGSDHSSVDHRATQFNLPAYLCPNSKRYQAADFVNMLILPPLSCLTVCNAKRTGRLSRRIYNNSMIENPLFKEPGKLTMISRSTANAIDLDASLCKRLLSEMATSWCGLGWWRDPSCCRVSKSIAYMPSFWSPDSEGGIHWIERVYVWAMRHGQQRHSSSTTLTHRMVNKLDTL